MDSWLLRSREWIRRNGLRVGATLNLRLTEIETRVSGLVLSIVAGPEVMAGDRDVVISAGVQASAASCNCS